VLDKYILLIDHKHLINILIIYVLHIFAYIFRHLKHSIKINKIIQIIHQKKLNMSVKKLKTNL